MHSHRGRMGTSPFKQLDKFLSLPSLLRGSVYERLNENSRMRSHRGRIGTSPK